MIQLKVLIDSSSNGTDYFPETEYRCENCGIRGTFYSISPHRCEHCNHKIPDLRELKFSAMARRTYYFGRKFKNDKA